MGLDLKKLRKILEASSSSSVSIWIFSKKQLSNELYELFDTTAKKFSGKRSGSGTDLQSGEKDISFAFKNIDDAVSFYKEIKKKMDKFERELRYEIILD